MEVTSIEDLPASVKQAADSLSLQKMVATMVLDQRNVWRMGPSKRVDDLVNDVMSIVPVYTVGMVHR